MKQILSIVFVFFFLGCRNDEVTAAKQNIFDPANPSSFIIFKVGSDNFTACTNCGGSSNQPNSLFGYSDRIILISESYSSTAPTVWVSTDGTNFTKSSVKIGDCVGVSSSGSTSTTGCAPRIIGYENGIYAVLGQKFVNSPGQQTISAQYYGTGADLNTISLTTTSPGGNGNSNSSSIYSSGKFHFYVSGTTNYLYTTSDGSSWTTSTGFNCATMYIADNGSPTCGLQRYFNGTSWVAAGAITGGANSNYAVVYMDSIYRAWKNNSGTLSAFNSTSGTITGGITFPGTANSTVNMNGITSNPSKIAKTSGGVYLMATSTYINNVSTFVWLRSTDGNTWSSFTPTFPTDLGTPSDLNGYAALGNSFYAVLSLKPASLTYVINHLLKSSDGFNWTKVTLP